MNGERFERAVSRLLEKEGYSTRLTRGSSDRGIDVIAEKGGERVAVQAKAYAPQNTVGSPVVQKVSGTVNRPDIDSAMVITTSSFTSEAHKVADTRDVRLVSVGRSNLDVYETETDTASGDTSSQLDPDASSPRVDLSLLGAAQIRLGSGSPLILEQDAIEGVCIATALRSKASEGTWLPIDDAADVKITLQSGEVRHPEQASETPLAREWQTHDPSARMDEGTQGVSVDIRIDDRSLYFAVIDDVSIGQVKSLAVPRYSIDLNIESQVWNNTEYNNQLEKSLSHLPETELYL